MINNPVYRLNCEIDNCHFSLLVNDIPIAVSGESQSFSTTMSINQWLVEGSNNITFNYWFDDTLPFSENTKAKFSLFKIDASDKFGEQKINLQQFAINPPTSVQPKYKLVQLFKAEGAVFNNLLTSLTVINELDQVFNDVYRLYERIYECFSKKDIDAFLAIAIEKEKEYARVYYQATELRVNETRKMLTDLVNDPENKLLRHPLNKIKLKLNFEGRLFSLEDPEGNPAFLLANFISDTAHFIPLYFGYLNKKLYLIR
jgi:hypothetical protein